MFLNVKNFSDVVRDTLVPEERVIFIGTKVIINHLLSIKCAKLFSLFNFFNIKVLRHIFYKSGHRHRDRQTDSFCILVYFSFFRHD